MKQSSKSLEANGVAWLLQVVLSFALGLLFLLPIWMMTFQNANRPISVVQASILVFFTLLPIWLMQLLAFRFTPPRHALSRWLVLFGGYVAAIGPVYAIAEHLARMGKKNSLPYVMRLAVVFAFCALAVNLIFSVYAVIVFGSLTSLLMR